MKKNIFKKIWNYFIDIGILRFINDKKYLTILYKKKSHRRLNLDNPKRFTEKLQWLKLNYRKDIFSTMVDKYKVKEYISNTIGKEYTIPTLGVYDKFSEIDFNKLPNQFVIKCSHDSGSVVVVRNKEDINYKKLKTYFNLVMKRNFYYRFREWPYKSVKPRILIEKFMVDDNSDALTDYKFFCFNGVPKVMYISKDNSSDARTDFFDMEFNHLDLRFKDPNADVMPEKPKQFETMKQIAKKLSKDMPFVRVDFYVINEKIYFGEMTFYHLGGFFDFHPDEWDYKFGEWLKLPEKIK